MAERKVTQRSLYSWVLGSNLKYQVILVVLVVATVGARVFPLEMQKRIINEAIAFKDITALFLYSGLYISAVVLAGLLKYVLNVLQSFIGQKTIVEVRSRLFAHVLSLPLDFFRRTSPGHVISSIVQELAPIGDFIGMAIAVPLVNVLTFIAMGAYMFYLNPLLGAISIAIYPIDFMVLPLLQRRFNAYNRKRLRQMREMSSMVGESVSGVQEVHGNGSVALEGKKFSEHVNRLFRYNMFFSAYKFGIKFTNNFFQSLGPFSLFLVGGWLAIHGHFDLGALVAFLSAYEKLYDPWKELIEFYQAYQDGRVRYRQVMETFDLDPEHQFSPEGREPYSLEGNIAFRDVSFVVNGNIRLLDGISLELKHGEHLALVGFSGSGKSTLALVLAQLYTYSSGKVFIDGKELNNLTRQDVVWNTGIVAQQPFIFSGALRENLVYACEAERLQGGRKDSEMPDLDRLIEAVQQVGLFLDVLRFGTQGVIDPEENPDLVQRIIHARESFSTRHATDLSRDIEFFSPDSFMQYGSVAENIVFGAVNRSEFAIETLGDRPRFRAFLKKENIELSLVALGAEIAFRTIDMQRTTSVGDALFAETPVSRSSIDEIAHLVDRLARVHGSDPDASVMDISDEDRQILLDLALAYIPGKHGVAGLSRSLVEKLLVARQHFSEALSQSDPGAYSFYRPNEYISALSILNNILYGRIKEEGAGAEERIQEAVMRLLIEEDILERIVALGMEFQVGTMGDRLSGGQRQKVALARAFLKNPPILILDEATSALDNASQARISNLLQGRFKGTSTVVSVVHRLDTLPIYDRVVVLKNGRIVEVGSYDELIEKKGALYELMHG